MTQYRFEDHSSEVQSELERRVAAGLEAIGLEAEKNIKGLTPVQTGRLRNSISHTRSQNTEYIGTNVEYAPAVELKERYHRVGQAHYMRDGIQRYMDDYKRIMQDALT